MPVRILIISFLLLAELAGAQSRPLKLIARGYYSIYQKNDSEYLVRGLCNGFELKLPHNSERLAYYLGRAQRTQAPLVSVHGLLSYDYLYRTSLHDTYDQKDLQQHTVQANLTILIRDRYPLHLNFTTRQSNFPFYPNYFAPGLQFDRPDLERRMKAELVAAVQQKLMDRPDLSMLQQVLEKEREKYLGLRNWLQGPDLAQKIIEARERAYSRRYHPEKSGADSAEQATIREWNMDLRMSGLPDRKKDSLQKTLPSADSLTLAGWLDGKRKELDSLRQKVQSLEHEKDSIMQLVNSRVADARREVDAARGQRELRAAAANNGLELPKRKDAGSVAADFTKIGLGRSQVNYTELTAWNINLTGIDLEYNPRFYAAFAAGRVDYGFRDVLGRNRRPGNQQLVMGRIGWGLPDHGALILSVFNGRKYNYANGLVDTGAHTIGVLGYSLEAIMRCDDRRWLSAEVAKSTRPATGDVHNNGSAGSLFDFSDRSNLGVNIKGAYGWPRTGTNFSGFYRRTGTYFQSFSLFTYNTDQTSWQLKGEQQFLKGKLSTTLMLRQNEFTNPYLEKTYKTSTVFKTVQIQVRVPKWPVVNAGYYPGTQLYVVDGNRMRESVYYIFNGSLMHVYPIGHARGVSSFVFNRYFNQSTDSGFVAYRGTNYLFAQTIFLHGFQLKAGGAYTDQQELRYSTIEAGFDISLLRWLKLGAGEKYNKVVDSRSYWGHRLDLQADLHTLGNIQLQYEKSYLPTVQHNLYGVEQGRVSWYKYF